MELSVTAPRKTSAETRTATEDATRRLEKGRVFRGKPKAVGLGGEGFFFEESKEKALELTKKVRFFFFHPDVWLFLEENLPARFACSSLCGASHFSAERLHCCRWHIACWRISSSPHARRHFWSLSHAAAFPTHHKSRAFKHAVRYAFSKVPTSGAKPWGKKHEQQKHQATHTKKKTTTSLLALSLCSASSPMLVHCFRPPHHLCVDGDHQEVHSPDAARGDEPRREERDEKHRERGTNIQEFKAWRWTFIVQKIIAHY